MTAAELAFRRAICENPGEDTHRLAYADWLDERDEPGDAERAEFIRVQCELARMPPYENIRLDLDWSAPGFSPECKRAVALRRRERELFEAHAAAWVPVPDGYKLMVALLDASGRACANVAYSRGNVKATGDMRFYFARGFAEEVWVSAADWLEHERALFWHPDATDECENCGGEGEVGADGGPAGPCPCCGGKWNSGPFLDRDDYWDKGTGRVPRPCPPTAQPIERVMLTDEPSSTSDQEFWRDALYRADGWHHPRWPGVVFAASADQYDRRVLRELERVIALGVAVPPSALSSALGIPPPA